MHVRHFVLTVVVAALFVTLPLVRSGAHTPVADDGTVVDWYPQHCCDDKDCRPVRHEYVYNTSGMRTHVRMLVEGKWEQYSIVVVQLSKDHLAHWCGTVKPHLPQRAIMMECAFVPKGAS